MARVVVVQVVSVQVQRIGYCGHLLLVATDGSGDNLYLRR